MRKIIVHFFIGDSQANYFKGGLLFIFAKVSTKELFFISVISHNSGPLLEETRYYPGGLTMIGISNKKVSPVYKENKNKFNGKELENQEFKDGTGLEMYDFGARMQDPQLMLFHNLDPKADAMRRLTEIRMSAFLIPW